jgi:hypothetical protein
MTRRFRMANSEIFGYDTERPPYDNIIPGPIEDVSYGEIVAFRRTYRNRTTPQWPSLELTVSVQQPQDPPTTRQKLRRRMTALEAFYLVRLWDGSLELPGDTPGGIGPAPAAVGVGAISAPGDRGTPALSADEPDQNGDTIVFAQRLTDEPPIEEELLVASSIETEISPPSRHPHVPKGTIQVKASVLVTSGPAGPPRGKVGLNVLDSSQHQFNASDTVGGGDSGLIGPGNQATVIGIIGKCKYRINNAWKRR